MNASREKKDLGDRAENLVAEWLESQGIEVLARNVRLSYLEIDIVARDADLALVVEVRARGAGAWTSGFSSITGEKRLRLKRASERLWNRRFKRDPNITRLRIDVASVQLLSDGRIILEYAKGAL